MIFLPEMRSCRHHPVSLAQLCARGSSNKCILKAGNVENVQHYIHHCVYCACQVQHAALTSAETVGSEESSVEAAEGESWCCQCAGVLPNYLLSSNQESIFGSHLDCSAIRLPLQITDLAQEHGAAGRSHGPEVKFADTLLLHEFVQAVAENCIQSGQE